MSKSFFSGNFFTEIAVKTVFTEKFYREHTADAYWRKAKLATMRRKLIKLPVLAVWPADHPEEGTIPGIGSMLSGYGWFLLIF